MHVAFIQLGCNLGDRPAALAQSKTLLRAAGIHIQNSSSIYETAAWGPIPQPDFLNQIICIQTTMDPLGLMEQLLAVEQKMGRIRTEKMGPRVIDLDLLFYDDLIFQSEALTITHPFVQERRFILEPMTELDPHFIHTVLQQSILQLLNGCKDPMPVKKHALQETVS